MKKYHIISHTHWDREWYRTFQQFRLKLVHLVDKLLAILESDRDFKYFMLDGQTIILEDYLAVRPEEEDILKQHIQEGRILIGPWHILPDMFLVSPEAHIRNLLQGDRTARKFGPKMKVGYIPDPFGHPGQTPQILKGFGIHAAALWRGLSEQPPELFWESPDGSRVFLAYLRDSYSNGSNLAVGNPELFTQQLDLAGESLLEHSAIDACLIMLGTDHMEPSTNTSAAIAFADEHLPKASVLHSTLPAYLQNVYGRSVDFEESLPVVHGELRACDRAHLLPGVLSTRMWLKQRNHHSQTLLEQWAEPFSVFAESFLSNRGVNDEHVLNDNSKMIANVAPLLRQAWRYLMQNHPHDSICGCSIDQVHEEMKPRFDQADQISEELIAQSLQKLSSSMNTKKEGAFSALVVFNPFNTAHRDLVEVDLDVPENVPNYQLIDISGRVVPHEFIDASHEELANILVDKKGLRDTIGGAHEGWVAGMAILQVNITRHEATVRIEAVLDEEGQPDLQEWQKAEKLLAQFEADPEITRYHVLAHTPRSSRIRFVSPKIPPLGWQVLWAQALPENEAAPPKEVHPLLKPLLPLVVKFAQTDMGGQLLASLGRRKGSKPPFVIQNEFYRVEADPRNGTLEITDQKTGVVFTGLNRFIDGGDAGDTYNYSPPEEDILITPKVDSIEVVSSPLLSSIEIKYLLTVPPALDADRKTRRSERLIMPIQSRISLISGVARVDVHTEVENRAKDHRLRVHFPAPFTVEEAYHDGHFEVVRRPVGVQEKEEGWVEDPRPEVPQRAFTDIVDGNVGLMIANRGLPEVEVLDGSDEDGTQTEIALTLLRCVGWLSRGDLPVRQGHAGPAYETPGAQMNGKWAFEYAIIPHDGGWRDAVHRAYTYQSNLRAIETGLHDGELPGKGSIISHSPEEFIISAVKPAEKGGGLILRGINITGEALRVNIRTYAEFSKVYRVNLAEENREMLEKQDDGSILIPVSGYEIVSILFENG